MILKYMLTCMKNQPSYNSYKSCKTIYKIKGEGHVSLVVKISLYTPFVGVVGNVRSKKNRKKDRFLNILLYISILFCLKNVHCLPMK